MQLKFCVMITNSDWRFLTSNDIQGIVWTHLDAVNWLDQLNYYSDYDEIFMESTAEWHISLTYTIDHHTLDFLLLKWPRLFETRATYETVELIQ